MSFIDKITELFSRNSGKPVKSISKEEIVNILKCNINRLELLRESYKSVKGFGAQLENRITKAKNDKSMQYVGIYYSFADRMEHTSSRTNPMKAIIDNINSLIDVYQQLVRKINTIVDIRNINIYNAKISHSILFGFIANTENYCSFLFAMLAGMIFDLTKHNGTNEIAQLTKKEIKILTDSNKYGKVVSFFNSIETKNISNVIRSIDTLATDNDHIVDANGALNSRINLGSLNDRKFTGLGVAATTATVLTIGAFIMLGMYTITHIAELIAWYQNDVYERNKAEAEWIKNHIAVLELELAGMDPDSEEYRKKVKIIENYQKILAKYEADIAAYEAED